MKKPMFYKYHVVFRNNRGFTLIEVMVTLLLLSLVMIMVYQFVGFSNKMFRKSDERAAQQDQARLIVQGLRKDIGTALSIRIAESADPGAVIVDEGYYALYVQDGKRMVRKDHDDTDATATRIYSSFPIQNLRVEYTPVAGDDGLTVVHVIIYVEGRIITETDIYLENTTLPAGTLSGNLITYKPS